MNTYRFEAHPCPYCGHILDAAGSLEVEAPRRPEAGDITLCLDCGEWLTFVDDRGAVRKPTDAELISIGLDPLCGRARAAWMRMKEEEAR